MGANLFLIIESIFRKMISASIKANKLSSDLDDIASGLLEASKNFGAEDKDSGEHIKSMPLSDELRLDISEWAPIIQGLNMIDDLETAFLGKDIGGIYKDDGEIQDVRFNTILNVGTLGVDGFLNDIAEDSRVFDSVLTKGKKAYKGAAETGDMRYLNTPCSKVSRGIRNTEMLSDTQQAQIYKHIEELGLNPDDFFISSHMSCYSDMLDKAFLGPDMLNATSRTQSSVFESMTPRAAIAHEAGHMINRSGTAFEAGSLYDEIQASLTGRELSGLNNVERYQLLRDAAERAKIEGQNLRDIISEIEGK